MVGTPSALTPPHFRFSNDKGKHYRIVEERGEQLVCNQHGHLIKPFDPNLTGKFNYNRRLQIMKNQNPHEKEHVELPKCLILDSRRNYSPQNNLLEGYNQMPRQLSPPYQNNLLHTKRDIVLKLRS